MKYLFYDVETAHPSRAGSICAIGWCMVQDMCIIDQGYTLINPKTEFSPINIDIHGITPKDVSEAPSFAEYWHHCLCDLMHDCVVVAHNAGFDIKATRYALFNADIPDDGIDYCDFLPVAQKLLPKTECANHKLNTLAKWAGITFNHHCASDDCHTLFQIAKTLCHRKGFNSLEEMFAHVESAIKNSKDSTLEQQNEDRSSKHVPSSHLNYKKPPEPVEHTDDALSGCTFCITGEIGGYSRTELEAWICSHGGQFKGNVSRKLDFLVVGVYDETYPPNYISKKHKQALEEIEKGASIQIISDEQFLDIMKDPSSSPFIIFAIAGKQQEKACTSLFPQSPQEIEAMWKESVLEQTDDDDAFSYSPTQSGFSFFVYGKKSFELVRSKKGMSLRISGDLLHFLCPDMDILDETKFYTLPADKISNFPASLKAYKKYVFRNLITDTFACCHRFMQCSDARECLMKHDRTYNGCYYRRNLEKGLIFYGKNRNADEHGLFQEIKRPE